VVEVRYVQRTQDGILRLPVFVRVRDDKAAEETESASAVRRIAGRGTAGGTRVQQPVPLHASREVRDVLRQLDQLEGEGTLEIGGVALRVTNLDKALWPAPPSKRMRKGATAALTKRDLLRYLALVSPSLLAHLSRRPVTLTRHPNGAGEAGFYQRHWDGAVPPYVKVVRLPSEGAGEEREFLLLESLPALLHAGQLAALELHPWYLRVGSERPDFVVFDLDSYLYSGEERPGEEPAPHAKGFDAARKAAWLVKGELDALQLPAFVKTSGRTGLHIFVPIRRRLEFEETHAIARTMAERLERAHPQLLTTAWSVAQRRGKVFLDYNMNARSKTLAAAYSPRAAAGAPVSVPIGWEELDVVVPQELTIHTVPARLAERGDPWEGILDGPADLAARLRAA
jgi:bifunctional non-homologous end joining protein LigD